MNVLFVNYGDFTTNSLNHIAGFARALSAAGHACAVAVPSGPETLSVILDPKFLAVTFREALERPRFFPGDQAADIVHAWTPREGVRKFVLDYQRQARSRLLVHLEDNEEFLLTAWLGKPMEALRDMGERELAAQTSGVLSHPRRHRFFLRAADGVTVITPRLREFVPPDVPCEVIEPGVDPRSPAPAGGALLRRELDIGPREKIIVFTGSNTFANEPEVRDLYDAVAQLNARGVPTRLIRTGFASPGFLAALPEETKVFVRDLGFVPKSRLPALLAEADVLVQPGRPGAFNDYRLPSKLPEFFAAGRPVVLPAANVGLDVRDGEDALVLRAGSPEEIADACERVFRDPALADTLGRNALAFARRRFDLAANSRRLEEFYRRILAAPVRPGSTAALGADGTELSLALAGLASRSPDPEHAKIAAELVPLVSALEKQDMAAAERLAFERDLAEARRNYEIAQKRVPALEKELALSRQHISNLTRIRLPKLEETLRLTRQHAVNLENLRRSIQRRVRELDAQCAHLTRTIEARDAVIAQRDDTIAQREAKLRTVLGSASWRLTLPLRFLRRRLIDPWRRQPAPARPPEALPPGPAKPSAATLPAEAAGAPPPHPPAGPDALRYNLDFPQNLHLPLGRTVFRGWCAAEDGRRLIGIRARLPDRTVEGTYGFKRPDVAASAGELPGAGTSGWQVALDLNASDVSVELEAADEGGSWLPFFRAELQVSADAPPPDGVSYGQWVEAYDTPTIERLNLQMEEASQMADPPLISVLMPVYNTPERWLRRAIESVRNQTYPNWELCIADDASTEPHVRMVLETAAAAERRIRIARREKNGHIAAASNSALNLAWGDFVALLDHDDELAPGALFEVASALKARPDADYLYSDEDKIDGEGHRFEPYFKPDWLPDLFLGQNYTSHLSVYRTALVRSVGGFREGFEGSQDWDLALRVTEKTPPERIVHIPKILYHWRAVPGSTALLLSAKDYTLQAARRALQEHFDRTGHAVEILPVECGHWRIRHPLPADPPLVSLIIPTRNGLSVLRRCVDSLLERTSYPNFEILVVDNGSDDPETLAYLDSLDRGTHRLLRPHHTARVLRYPAPFNYSAINNFAVGQARGELVGLLNNDLEAITPDWLEEMASQALRPEIGCVGAMLYYPDETIQHAGAILGVGGVAGHAFRMAPRGTEGQSNRARMAQNYSAVTAACLVVRKQVYREVGGLDEETLPVAFNDIDFCLKVRAAGYRNLWTPFAEFYHHESATRGLDDTPEKVVRFQAEIETMLGRWGSILSQDPAYNPNLTLVTEDFSLASPPRLADQILL